MSKRAWKHQEFVAHSGSVHCARLGEKSGAVLATGGDDKRVNIWKVGKPHAMMSLTGHSSAVECLVFDKQEEVLVCGCSGGSMQVWNLEYRKMAGTLPGHRTACNSVEFHPYGEFFASGSSDTNLKIWDLRRKSCIQTYKGHLGAVTSIRFSPHGRWVATGGQDNMVKLWDLTAGKLMKDLDLHKGPITSLAFHPKEYLLATGSSDRTCKLWSLESFRCAGTTDICTSSVQAVKFYVEESTVLCASNDSLRVFPTDGLTTPVDVIDVDWRGLQDMRLCLPEEKIMGVSTEGTQLGIWVADLQKGSGIGRPPVGNAPGRLPVRGGANSYVPAKPQAPPPRADDRGESEADWMRADPSQPARDENLDELRPRAQEQAAHRGQGSSPNLTPYGGMSPPHANGDSVDQAFPDRRRDNGRPRNDLPPQRGVASPQAHGTPGGRPGLAAGGASPGGPPLGGASPGGPPPSGLQLDDFGRPTDLPPFADRRSSRDGIGGGLADAAPDAATLLPSAAAAAVGPTPLPKAEAMHQHTEPELLDKVLRSIQANNGTEDRGMQSPMPPQQSPMQPQQSPMQPQPSPLPPQRPPEIRLDPIETLTKLSSQHTQMVGVLQRRMSQAKRAKDLWSSGNLTNLTTGLQFPQDHAVVCDLARAVMRQRQVSAMNLDACQILLPIMRELMTSKYDDFVITAMQFTELLLQNFGENITEIRRTCARIPERQLDIAREERLRKCNACHQHFCEVHKLLLDSRFANQLASFRMSLQTFVCRA